MAVIGYSTLQVIPTLKNVTSEMTGQLSGPMAEAGKKAGNQLGQGVASGLEQSKAKVEKASGALAKARSAEKDASDKVFVAEQKLQALRNKGVTDVGRLADAEARVNKAKRDAELRSNATATADRNLARARDGVTAASRSGTQAVQQFGDATDQSSRRMTGAVAAGALAAKGIEALGTAALNSIKFIAEIGTTFTEVRSKIQLSTGTSGAALDKLNQSVKNVAKGSPAAIGTIAERMTVLYQRTGLTGETLETLTKQVNKAGAALGQDLDLKQLTGTMAVFGVQGKDISAVLDDIFRVSRNTGMGMNEIISAAKGAAPSLQEFGFNLSDSAALIGTLDKAGVDAASTVSTFGKGLIKMAKAGQTPKEAFRDITAQIQEFIRVGDMGGATRVASGIFGKGALQFVNAVKSGAVSMDQLTNSAAKQGDSILDAEGATVTWTKTWNLFKNNVIIALEPLATRFFNVFIEGMTWLRENGVTIIQGLSAVFTPVFDVISPLAERIFPTLGAALVGVGTAVSAVTGFMDRHRTTVAIVATIIGTILTPYLITLGVQWTIMGAKAVVAGAQNVWAWATLRAEAVKSAVVAVASAWKTIGGWVLMGAQAVAQGARASAAWIASGARSATAWVALRVGAVGAFVATSAAAVTHGVRTGAAWVASSARSAGGWLAMQARAVGAFVATSAAAAVNAGRTALVWVASMGRTALSVGAATAAFVAQRAVMVAGAVVTGVMTAAQWALNAALLANPITWVVLAIGGLIAAIVLIATKTTWFQTLWQLAWTGIKTYIGVVWNVIKGYFSIWMTVFRAAGDVVMWLWNNAITPAFRGIGDVISFVWNSVVKPVWDNFRLGLDVLGQAFTTIWNNVVKPVWNALGAGVKWVWENVIRVAFDALKSALGAVGNTFSTIADGIRIVWDKIKEYARKPIAFVVNTVWNNGLRSVWDKLDDFLPIPKAPGPIQFAEGGPVPMGPGAKRGKDSVNALLMPEEHVWDRADVRKSGGQGAQYRMRSMIERGQPFTWTPNGLAGASEGGPLARFAEGGAVEAGQRLAPVGGEGGLKPIAVLMRRIIFKLWKKITDIGGYRQDAYPEHPSGRALDVMVPNIQTGDQVNGWVHANAPKFPIEHTLWKQRWRPQGNINGEPMEDRGSATQNHFDHVHAWYKEQNVDPNVVPDGLVGFDGMTPEDKRSWLQKKAEEIITGLLGGIKNATLAKFPGGDTVFQNIPKEFVNGTFGKMLDKTREIISKISNPGIWYDKGKGILGNVTKSIWGGVKKVGGLFRDQGGFVPTGQSVVTNETGKPEAILNWQQLNDVKALMDKGATLSAAIAQVGATKTDGDTIPEGAVVLKSGATAADVQAAADKIKAVSEQQQKSGVDPSAGQPDTSGAAAAGQPGQMKSLKELGQDAGGIIAEGIAETFDLPSWIVDPGSALKGDDGSNVRTTSNSGATAGNSAITNAPSTSSPGGYTAPGDPYNDDGSPVTFGEEKSKIGNVAEGPGGMPNIQYNPSGGAEQWRPLAQWAIDYVNQSMKGAAQLQAMVEQIGDESGGNPKAVNNWDVNAQNGVPSGGLLQVIEPTFQASRDPRLPNDKFNPGANLVAALRYYVPKYGKDLTARWGHGKGGYKFGGYTGNLGLDDIAGFVHGREFVTSAGPTRKNINLLELIQSGADVESALVAGSEQWGSVAGKAPRQLVGAGTGGRTTNITVYGNTTGDIVREIGRQEFRGSRGYGSRSHG